MTTLALVAITVYAGQYVGEPLYCGGYYDDVTPPWVAMPISTYGLDWECGDRIGVKIDGDLHFFDALDAGPFGRFCVRQLDGTCPRIAADIPAPHAPFTGLSTVGEVWNVERLRERWEQYRD